MGDERRIGQILINLVSNALKFSPLGGNILIRAHCKGSETSEDKNTYSIFVKDQGPGI